MSVICNSLTMCLSGIETTVGISLHNDLQISAFNTTNDEVSMNIYGCKFSLKLSKKRSERLFTSNMCKRV